MIGLMLSGASRAAEPTEKEDLKLFNQDLGISLWDESYSVRNGVGYKDNVLLDESQPKQSPFFVNGLDITVFRLPTGGWEYYFLVSGDDIRYWHDIGVGSEDLWIAAGKLKRDFGEGWQFGLTASYAYEAQVLDLLNAEGLSGQLPTKVNGHTITLRPSLRRKLAENWWVELQLEGTRQLLTSPGFSYWRAGPKILLGRDYGKRSEVSVSYSIWNQPFDSESQVNLDASDLPGTQLRYLTQRVEGMWRHYWDKRRLWENTTKLAFEYNRDNGSGYFNYYLYRISEQFDYDGAGWKVTALAMLQNYVYPRQTVNDTPGTDLYQTGVTVNLHVERLLVGWMKLFAEYEYEHAFSNEFTEHYRVNTVKGGVSWEF